jgi:hypothetical protein
MNYEWLEPLGGRRRPPKGQSVLANLGLRNESFRNYADYMLTNEFRQGIDKLLKSRLKAEQRSCVPKPSFGAATAVMSATTC